MNAASPPPRAAPGRRCPHPGSWSGAHVLSLRRGPLVAVTALFAALVLWSAATAWYLLFRDEIAVRFMAKQAEMQFSYEEKIGALRAQVDRLESQKLLEQDGLEKRLAELSGRQARIESRQAVLSALAEGARRPPAGLPKALSAAPLGSSADLPQTASAYAPVSPKPMPAPEPFGLRLRDGREDDPVQAAPQRQSLQDGAKSASASRLAQIEASLARVKVAQLQAVEHHWRRIEQDVSRIRAAVEDTGLDPDRLKAPALQKGVGGPLIPLSLDPKAGPFEAMAEQAWSSLAQFERLRRVAAALPLERPVAGDLEQTSGFGYRLDPFTRTPALHTGLDFRAEAGQPVRATAAGRVVTAEHTGGYGNMVEIDHGNGLTTRYAHLSAVVVAAGQTVGPKTVVGYVGSTGRSTGPHLHYETRLDGEPLDPQRFLRAGALLVAARGGP